MFRLSTSFRQTPLLLHHRFPPTSPAPLHLIPSLYLVPSHRLIRPYSKEVTFTSQSLQELTKDQLIATCMNEKVKWMQEKSELRDMWMQEKLELRDILMKEKATMATEKDACLREIIQVKEAVLQVVNEKCRAEIELNRYFEQCKVLRLQFLRQEDKFNVRGIIEFISNSNVRFPDHVRSVQARLNYIADNCPDFRRCFASVLARLKLRSSDVDSSRKQLYQLLSKHFHQHNLKGNSDDLVIDTTPGTTQGFAVLDGAAIEAYLQFGMVPYTTVCKDQVIRFEVVGPGKMMREVIMPKGYRRTSWLDFIVESPGMPANRVGGWGGA